MKLKYARRLDERGGVGVSMSVCVPVDCDILRISGRVGMWISRAVDITEL